MHLRRQAREIEVIGDEVLLHLAEELVALKAAEPADPARNVLVAGSRIAAVACLQDRTGIRMSMQLTKTDTMIACRARSSCGFATGKCVVVTTSPSCAVTSVPTCRRKFDGLAWQHACDSVLLQNARPAGLREAGRQQTLLDSDGQLWMGLRGLQVRWDASECTQRWICCRC